MSEIFDRFAGYVLVGGNSMRMGRDKALLPYSDTVLADFIAAEVAAAAGSVSLVGRADRYGALGRRVLEDLRPGNGPLAGVETALADTAGEWSLIVACDMPRLERRFLRELLSKTLGTKADCVVPVTSDGLPEPLCAVWRRCCRQAVSAALDGGRRKTQSVFSALRVDYWKPAAHDWTENVNTPEDWGQRTPRRPAQIPLKTRTMKP